VRDNVELFHEATPDPWWKEIVPWLRRLSSPDLPANYLDGYVFPSPIAEMPLYLAYLERRFRTLGGVIKTEYVTDLEKVAPDFSAVVNCAGMGARELTGDHTMTPIRGQVVRTSQVGIDRTYFDQHGHDGVTYIVPRSNDCILGGTAEEGSEDLTPDPATTAAIIARCTKLEPRLADATILEQKVGIRPGRPAIRLEAETTHSGIPLIHNYGHGGAGIALSWGCADEVAKLASRS
jgi:D-amino-acid oxidase